MPPKKAVAQEEDISTLPTIQSLSCVI